MPRMKFRQASAFSIATRSPRRGMSLVEVIVALVILGALLTGLAVFAGRMARDVGQGNIRSTAGDLVADRLEEVKGSFRYSTIEATYAGVENPVTNFPTYRRETLVQRIGGQPGDLVDYKVVTVVVTATGLSTPVRKTTVISSF